jgi:two-component system CheB/CheR fusion protein
LPAVDGRTVHGNFHAGAAFRHSVGSPYEISIVRGEHVAKRRISLTKPVEQYEQRLAAIVESCDDAIVSKNLEGIIDSWNRSAERLFGYAAEEALGRPIIIIIPPDRFGEETEILERIRRGESTTRLETTRRRKDGSLIDVSITVSPVKNTKGKIIGASKVARDITERKRADEQQRLLLAELDHRIRNCFTMVQVLATQTLHGASDEERQTFVGRVQALAKAQALMTGKSWHHAPLHDIVARAMEAFGNGDAARVEIQGPPHVSLDAASASRLAMALHELATNAVKHGALSNERGRVRITWQVPNRELASRVRLQWQESGGPEVAEPTREGFGSRLLKQLLGSDGQLEYRPEGLVCTLEMAI